MHTSVTCCASGVPLYLSHVPQRRCVVGLNMKLLKLFIRREPSQLRPWLFKPWSERAAPMRMDTVCYYDSACQRQAAVYPWFASSKPNRRSTKTMHNCFLYELVWGADLTFDSDDALKAHQLAQPSLPHEVRMHRVIDSHGQSALLVLA